MKQLAQVPAEERAKGRCRMKQRSVSQIQLAVFGFLLAICGIFWLPYRFPPTIPTYSHSYLAGYSNRVASLAAIFCAATLFFINRYFVAVVRPQRVSVPRLPLGYLYGCSLVYVTTLGLLSFCASRSPYYYGESTYFVLRVDQVIHSGQVPYRDFEWAYGWLQVYFPACIYWLLRPVHASVEVSYYVSLIIMMVLGLWLLYEIVNDRILNIPSKKTTFVLIALAMLNITLGLNYTPVRFLIAPFLLLLLADQLRGGLVRLSGIIALSSFVAWSIAPEAGIAYSIAAALFIGMRAMNGNNRLFVPALFSGFGFAIVSVVFGRNYLSTLRVFASGLGSSLVVPAPYIVFFLVTLIWIVPAGLAAAVRNKQREIPMLISFAVMGLVYVGAALGRCDPGHVLWNGVCILLLGFVFIAAYSRTLRLLYTGAFALLFTLGIHVGVGLTYLPQLRDLARSLRPAGVRSDEQFAALDPLVRVAAPLVLDKRTENYLASHGKLAHDPFISLANVFDQRALDAKLTALADAPYLLGDLTNCCSEDPKAVFERIMLYPLSYTSVHDRYSPGEHLRQFVEARFEKIGVVGNYSLYRNRMAKAKGERVRLNP